MTDAALWVRPIGGLVRGVVQRLLAWMGEAEAEAAARGPELALAPLVQVTEAEIVSEAPSELAASATPLEEAPPVTAGGEAAAGHVPDPAAVCALGSRLAKQIAAGDVDPSLIDATRQSLGQGGRRAAGLLRIGVGIAIADAAVVRVASVLLHRAIWARPGRAADRAERDCADYLHVMSTIRPRLRQALDPIEVRLAFPLVEIEADPAAPDEQDAASWAL